MRFVPAIFLLSFAGAALAPAKSPVDPVNQSKGVAIKGYDPVAYFTQSKPVKGSAGINFSWGGATWWFASREDRDAFQADPSKYAPQFGGYCAWAVGHNYTADTDPAAWKIVDGKLYLNYSRDIQKKWEVEQPKLIEEATRNWPALHR
jgi:YHS domain-containing protein